MIEKEVQSVDLGAYDTLTVNGQRIPRYDNLALHCAGLQKIKSFKSPFSHEGTIITIGAIAAPVTVKIYDGLVDRHTVYRLQK